MHDERLAMRRWVPWLAAAAAALLPCAPARAHSIRIFAQAEGRKIAGEVYFAGGGRGAHLTVTVRGPAGELLGKTTTDANGNFVFVPTRRCNHTFLVVSGDGHRASYPLEADLLPPDLPRGDGGAHQPSASGPVPAETAAPATAPAGERKTALASDEKITRVVLASDEQIARIVRSAVRLELDKYKGEVRLRDVLAGLGWIAGLAGAAMYVLSRRRGGRDGAGRQER